MRDYTDEEILEIFLPNMTPDKRSYSHPEPTFSLETLVGKTIKETRTIKGPQKPGSTYDEMPKEFKTLVFNDDSILLFERWGDGDSMHLNSYFYDGINEKILYHDSLFEKI